MAHLGGPPSEERAAAALKTHAEKARLEKLLAARRDLKEAQRKADELAELEQQARTDEKTAVAEQETERKKGQEEAPKKMKEGLSR